MLFNFFIILLNVVFISSTIINSNKTQENDVEKQIRGERIIGGRFALQGERPYQVSVRSSDGYFCGGSILETDQLKNRVIVTAAHCVAQYEF
jgi:secreted trypsin-like serine protease